MPTTLKWDATTESDKQEFTFAEPPNEFVLESGEKLGPITVAYETCGALARNGQNAILIVHALTGDSHVARHSDDDPREGWWEALVGPGRAIDTDQYFVVCANVLGGCQGTTGPSSINPRTGRPYGMSFPVVTIRDMVRVQKELLDYLGVKRLVAVMGGSMGGMQALEWAVTFPDFMKGTIPIATPARQSPQAIGYNEVQRRAIMLDPTWKGGNYKPGDGPAAGLAAARMLGMITYQSEEIMRRKFGFRLSPRYAEQRFDFASKFEVESYLHYQGRKLVRRFDANTYLYLTKAMDLFDISFGRGSYEAALARIKAKVLLIGVSSDILYPAYQQKQLVKDLRAEGVDAAYEEIESPCGHDGFLIEFEKMSPIVRGFLASLDSVSSADRRRYRANPKEQLTKEEEKKWQTRSIVSTR